MKKISKSLISSIMLRTLRLKQKMVFLLKNSVRLINPLMPGGNKNVTYT